MQEVTNEELTAYVSGVLAPERAREIQEQAETDKELSSSIWLVRQLFSFFDQPRENAIVAARELQIDQHDSTRFHAQGGLGEIWLARDSQLDREVAIKVLRADRNDPDLRQRFLQEARITARLENAGIPPVHLSGMLPDGRPFFTMKFVKGDTLYLLLRARPSSQHDQSKFITIFDGICRAVAHAHKARIIHRDLKPSNIMVGDLGEVQVMDWGLGKDLTQKACSSPVQLSFGPQIRTAPNTSAQATNETGAVGTPAYLSPEQARGEPVDPTTDVFALGAILCEILTGKPPITGDHDLLQKAKQYDLAEAIARLNGCGADAELIDLAKDCLAERRENRPADAKAIVDRLTAYREGLQDRLRKAERDRATLAADRRTFRWQVAFGVVVLGGIGSALHWYQVNKTAQAEQALIDKQEQTARETMLALKAKLKEVNRLRNKQMWSAALKEWESASDLLNKGKKREGEPSYEQMREDLSLAAQLAECRVESGLTLNGRLTLTDGAFWYEQVFKSFGIDLRADGSAEEIEAAAATKIEQKSVSGECVVALCHWRVLTNDRALQNRLKRIASRVKEDSHVWSTLKEIVEALEAVEASEAANAKDLKPLERLLAASPKFDKAFQFLILANALTVKDSRDALGLLRKAREQFPEDLYISVALANCLTIQEPAMGNEAVGYYWAALSAHPDSLVIGCNRARALLAQGRANEALKACDRVIETIKHSENADTIPMRIKSAEVWNLKGSSLKQLGRMDEAIDGYQKAIEYRPDYPQAYYNLASTLSEKKDYDGALKASEKAIALYPKYTRVIETLGRAFYNQGKMAEAMANYQKAFPKPNGPQAPNYAYEYEQRVEYERQLNASREAVARFNSDNLDLQTRSTPKWHRGPLVQAACVAVSAANSRDEGNARHDEKQRALWRQQGLDWLNLAYNEWDKLLKTQDRETRQAAVSLATEDLHHWLADPDLASVRPDAIELLPVEQREPWRQFWTTAIKLLPVEERKTWLKFLEKAPPAPPK